MSETLQILYSNIRAVDPACITGQLFSAACLGCVLLSQWLDFPRNLTASSDSPFLRVYITVVHQNGRWPKFRNNRDVITNVLILCTDPVQHVRTFHKGGELHR